MPSAVVWDWICARGNGVGVGALPVEVGEDRVLAGGTRKRIAHAFDVCRFGEIADARRLSGLAFFG
ncbi:hypothetical protein [Streptomyces sp. NPDC056785]|uniref:hypothetical protein n=1 Tax=Streptomyces sp. NPDC056785 TaxID=3345944 RepID=UPI0036994C8E